MRIVVDAMGGDHAPRNVVAGVVEAVKELPVTITLVGIEDRVKAELAKLSYPKQQIEIIHASEVVDMDDSPMDVIRRKKDCSMAVGVNLLKQPGYDAFVSAGNTGALVAAATFYLRMIEGFDRPGIDRLHDLLLILERERDIEVPGINQRLYKIPATRIQALVHHCGR